MDYRRYCENLTCLVCRAYLPVAQMHSDMICVTCHAAHLQQESPSMTARPTVQDIRWLRIKMLEACGGGSIHLSESMCARMFQCLRQEAWEDLSVLVAGAHAAIQGDWSVLKGIQARGYAARHPVSSDADIRARMDKY